MSPGLPLADPQFWAVTAGAALALGLLVRSALRRLRSPSEPPCPGCPRPGRGPVPPGGGRAGS